MFFPRQMPILLKRHIVFILILMIAVPVYAQKSKTDKLFDNKQYYAAAKAYEKELATGKGNSNELRKKIGLCYLRINRPQTALPYLKQIVLSSAADADLWYQYGLALQQTENYQEAIAAFDVCLSMQSHPTAQQKIESCRFALNHESVNIFQDYRPAAELNTPGSEFGTSLYTNRVVYYSSAAEPEVGAKIDPQTGFQYVKTLMTRIQNKRMIYPQLADMTLPSFVTDGLFAYDSLAHCLYFEYFDQSNSRSGIFSTKFLNGRWTNPEIVHQNRKDQVSAHPALANGGNRLFFTSTMTDGFGQTDIWFIDKLSGNRWGQPVNAGNVINTIGREEFPFVYADTLLFFASDGHLGFGGLDIFCSVIHGNTFSPPVNLRRPFNSSGDDFNLIISGNTGIFSSSRDEALSDDLFLFFGLPSFRFLSGIVTDLQTGDPIDHTRLTLTIDGKSVKQTVTDSNGYYAFYLRKNELPMLYVRTLGYKPTLIEVPEYDELQFSDTKLNIQLQPSIVVPATIQIFNKTTGVPVSERGIICYNNDGETQIMSTDVTGSFKLILQEDQREYWIRFPDGRFLTESIIINEEQKHYTIDVQPINEQLFAGWLFFKRGSVEPIEMSRALIPRIAAVIKENPGMTFLIEGFSDSVFEAYQPNLDFLRAEYIVKRLVEFGVNENQLVAAVGADKYDISEEEDTNQRRVEIKIRR